MVQEDVSENHCTTQLMYNVYTFLIKADLHMELINQNN